MSAKAVRVTITAAVVAALGLGVALAVHSRRPSESLAQARLPQSAPRQSLGVTPDAVPGAPVATPVTGYPSYPTGPQAYAPVTAAPLPTAPAMPRRITAAIPATPATPGPSLPAGIPSAPAVPRTPVTSSAPSMPAIPTDPVATPGILHFEQLPAGQDGSPGGPPSITIDNGTGYLLILSLRGPKAYHHQIAPGGRARMVVAPGEYDIRVRTHWNSQWGNRGYIEAGVGRDTGTFEADHSYYTRFVGVHPQRAPANAPAATPAPPDADSANEGEEPLVKPMPEPQ